MSHFTTLRALERSLPENKKGVDAIEDLVYREWEGDPIFYFAAFER